MWGTKLLGLSLQREGPALRAILPCACCSWDLRWATWEPGCWSYREVTEKLSAEALVWYHWSKVWLGSWKEATNCPWTAVQTAVRDLRDSWLLPPLLCWRVSCMCFTKGDIGWFPEEISLSGSLWRYSALGALKKEACISLLPLQAKAAVCNCKGFCFGFL